MSAWTTALKGWTTELRAAGRTPQTIRLRLAHLRHFAAGHPNPHAVTRTQLVNWLANPRWRPETRKSHRASLVGFYAWASDEGLIVPSPAARLPRIHVPEAQPRPASDEDIRRALAVANPRTLLMLRLGAELALRRGEIASADTRMLEQVGLRVCGKGGRVRVVPVPAGLRRALRTLPPGPVFPSPFAEHLTPGCVGKLMSAVLPAGVVPHQLRHAAATAWHDAGLDLLDIRPLLGHAKVSTTQRYVAVRPERAISAIEQAARRFAA
jgi:integrase